MSAKSLTLALLAAITLAPFAPAALVPPPPLPAETPAAKAVNAFTLDLYHQLAREKTGDNVFCSPLSVATALTMTYAGACNDTANEMAAILHLADLPDIHASFGSLFKELVSSPESDGCRLDVANAIWVQSGESWAPTFTETIRTFYDAGIFKVNFAAAEAARRTINDWVAEKTRDKIPDLLPPGTITDLTRLVLTNAVYFKGAWLVPFEEKSTIEQPFTLSDGTKKPAMMMQRTATFPYSQGPRFKTLSLPYVGDRLSMVIILPNEPDGLARLEKSLTPADLQKHFASLVPREVRVILPKFTFRTAADLGGALRQLGMTDAFTPSNADFSGMDGTRSLFISLVMHEAFVDVNEEGTEAAAATAVVSVESTGLPQPIPSFRADHPFLFLIHDSKTGAIIFIGRLLNPPSPPSTSGQ